MSTRPNPLREAMLGIQKPAPAARPVVATMEPEPKRATPSVAPCRIGKRSVQAHFEPAVARQLRMLAAELDRTTQDLLGEALNDLFRKYNKSAIAA